MEKRLFTSESVTEGHPDKVCDAISDAILDACMAEDPMSRVACETASCTGFVLVTGEITTKAQLDIPAIVRKTVNEIGYNDAKTGFDGNTCAVMVALDQQSPDIAMGVDKALEAKEGALTDNLDTGAGDQGMMFGYATNETPELMPYPISLAHKLALQLTKVRKDGTLTYLRPDGKTQVSVEYDEAGKPVRLEAVVLSTQHDDDVTQEQIHADIKKYVFDPILPKEMIDAVKAAGFQTLRLPVSWHNHVSGDQYTISAAWLDRVQEVLDYAIDNDMYVILNIHHDTDKEYCYPDKEHLEQSLSYMTFIWEQLADRFGDYDEHVIFESINEPRLVETDHEWWLDMNAAECVEAVECINEWNQNFVDVVRKTGGNNATRYLMVPGYDASADGVLNDKFVLPTDTAENEGKILVSVHAYIPYHFALQAATENESIDQFNASEKTSTNDIDQMMEKLYAKYISNEIPVVIGEFGARDKNGNLQSRVDYAAYYIAAARAYGMSCNWWDNNAFTGDGELFGQLDRKTVTWRYPKIVDALMKYAE